MCGICGILRLNGGPAVTRPDLERMAATLTHRGPDDQGYLSTDTAGFGFRRLSIIDLDGGNQPIANENGTIHVICNGEIFNHRELRERLVAKGHRFRTRSDVEVLVHLYEESGTAMFDELNGQFAFAIHDSGRRRTLLARDPFGVIPLFYTMVQESLVFASEIKALLVHPGVDRRVDLTGLDQVLSLPGPVSPRTMFAGVKSLPPGHFLVVENGQVRTGCYWDVDYPLSGEGGEASESAYLDELDHKLRQSVALRLRSDVPVAAYLSGGLDSSLIARLVRDLSTEPHATISISFEDRTFSEKKYQDLMVAHLRYPHHQLHFGTHEIAERLKRVILHCECPLRESYNTASMALSAKARESGFKVVLTGEGADELFAGYASYRFDALRQSQPPVAVSAEEAAIRKRLWGDPSFFYERDFHSLAAVKRGLFSPEINEVFEDIDFTRFPLVDHARISGRHPLHIRSYLDLKLRLADHLLADHGDRMLLASSVEGRYPFLDVGVLETVAKIPPGLKLKGFEEKYILKRLGKRYLPKKITGREKFGFVAPGTPHLLQQKIPWVEDLLSETAIKRQGYFDAAEVSRLKARYATPGFSLDLPLEDDLLMVVLTFGIFLETFQLPSL